MALRHEENGSLFGDEFIDQEYKSFGQVVGMLILTNGES